MTKGKEEAAKDLTESLGGRHRTVARGPLVSVTMPVYNGAKYLEEAILSLTGQTYRDIEILVVDDGSMDDSGTIINKINDDRIKYHRFEKNIGAVSALNEALAMARGKYICRLDQDDVSDPERIAKQTRYLEENKDISLVGSWFRCIDDQGMQLPFNGEYPCKHEDIYEHLLLKGCCIGHSTVMYRIEPVRKLGGYSNDREVRECPDYDLWLRMAREGYRFANLPEYLADYRIHNSQMSRAGISCTLDVYKTRKRALRDWGADQLSLRGKAPSQRIWRDLCGMVGSLGYEYGKRSDWHRVIGKQKAANQYAWAALRRSPLSRKSQRLAYRAFLESILNPSQLRAYNWYMTKLKRYCSRT